MDSTKIERLINHIAWNVHDYTWTLNNDYVGGGFSTLITGEDKKVYYFCLSFTEFTTGWFNNKVVKKYFVRVQEYDPVVKKYGEGYSIKSDDMTPPIVEKLDGFHKTVSDQYKRQYEEKLRQESRDAEDFVTRMTESLKK